MSSRSVRSPSPSASWQNRSTCWRSARDYIEKPEDLADFTLLRSDGDEWSRVSCLDVQGSADDDAGCRCLISGVKTLYPDFLS